MSLEFGVILETTISFTPPGRRRYSLHMPLSEVLADKTFIMLSPHMGEHLVCAEECFMTELRVS
jgi:hypothetical protein